MSVINSAVGSNPNQNSSLLGGSSTAPQLAQTAARVTQIAPALIGNTIWTQPPVVLSTPQNNASSPKIAIDNKGNLTAVWIENGFVITKNKSINTSWGNALTLSNADASSPTVVVDPDGNSTAIWVEGSVIKTTTKPFNGSWIIPAISLSHPGASSPCLAADENFIAGAWLRNGSVETMIKIAGVWGSFKLLQSTAASSPRIAIGGSADGKVYAVSWASKNENARNVISVARKLIKGWWAPTQVVSDLTANAINGDLTIDTKGNIAALWFRYSQEIFTNRFYNTIVQSSEYSPNDAAWSAIVNLSEPGIRDPNTLVARIVSDPNANKIALWTQSFDNSSFSLQSALKPIYKNWNPAVTLLNNRYAFSTDMAVSPLGTISFNLFFDGDIALQSAETDSTGFTDFSWTVPRTVANSGEAGVPQITTAMITQNLVNVAGIWTDFDGTNNTVLVATGVQNRINPPSNLSVTQIAVNLGTMLTYSNTLSWQPSPDIAVVGYLVYRNGVFLAQVASNVSQFIDYNQGTEPVTYGVASVDSIPLRSIIQTVSFP